MFSPWRLLGRAFDSTVSGSDPETPLLDRRTTELLARIAHEVRQPHSAARVAAGLIRHATDDSQRERASVVLDRQFVRLTRLFDDLLQASRLRMGKTVLQVEQVDLRRVVGEVVESVRPQGVEKRQHLTTHWPNSPVWIEADAVR